MSKDVFVWRDALDQNQFWIGVESHGKYYGWFAVFCDAFDECFGNGSFDKVRSLKGGVPVRVSLTFDIAPL